jgi:hypothetical protein
MPSQGDLILYQGDDEPYTVTVTLDGTTPADITGYTAQAQIRRAVADADPEVAATITCTVQSPEVLLSIPHAVTATLTGKYVWDLQLTSPEGMVKTVMAGKVSVTQEVTRAATAMMARLRVAS